MNEHRALYTRAVGVPEPRWTDLPPQQVSPPGVALTRVGPASFRSLTRTASTDLLRPEVLPYPKGSGWVRDELELAHRVQQARTLNAHLMVSGHAWAHLEQDQSRKIVLQRGGSPGWYVIADGLMNVSSPSLASAFSELRRMLELRPELEHPPARYVLGTTHGYPDFRTTNLSYLMHACWARASKGFDELEGLGLELARLLGEEDTPFSAALFTRTGPLGKPVTGYSIRSDGAYADAELLGYCCRRRVVFGMPSAGNMWQATNVAAFKTRIVQIPFFYHRGPADVAAKVKSVHRRGWVWFSDDISGYDQSVSDTHQRELAREVIAPLAGGDFAAYKLQWKDIPLLGPPLSRSAEGFLYTKKGMTPSGDLMTAVDGTLINAARVIRAVAVASGMTEEHARQSWGSRWCAFIQGDDTILGFEKGLIDMDKYVEVSEGLGYKTKLVAGVVFLMHLIDPETGRWTPLASRVYQQTVFNEYGGRAPCVELLSFVARATPRFMAENPWADEVLRMVGDGECFTRYGVTPWTATRALTDPVFVADLEAELPTVPHADKRFKDIDHSLLSDSVSRLLSKDDSSPLLGPQITRNEARTAALRIAAHMAVDKEERQTTLPTGLPAALAASLTPEGKIVE